MEIPKEQILSMLRERGQQDEAGRAQQELPDPVDPERDGGLLQKLGLNPMDLLSRFGGGGGGGGGGLGGVGKKLGL